MLPLLKRVSRRFLPTQEIVYSCLIDLGTAGGLWFAWWIAAPYLHPLADKLINFAIHVLILMAIWNPLQHMRRTYHMHVKRAFIIAYEWLTGVRLPEGPESCPSCGETKHYDEPLGVSLNEGTRAFACGFSMTTDGWSPSKCGKMAEAR